MEKGIPTHITTRRVLKNEATLQKHHISCSRTPGLPLLHSADWFRHNCIRFHLRIHYIDQPNCHCNGTSPADPTHLILPRPKFSSPRTILLNAIGTHRIPQPIHLPKLFNTPHTNMITKHTTIPKHSQHKMVKKLCCTWYVWIMCYAYSQWINKKI